MAKKRGKLSQTLAIVSLILNVIILPGLGTIIARTTQKRDIKSGIWQLVLTVVGLGFCLTIIGVILGIPMIIGAWIWALVESISFLKESV